MRLFLYGTLCHPRLLESFAHRPIQLHSALLHGWRRVALAGSRYPTLRRARDRVEGVIVTVDRDALRRLSAYEGPLYRLQPVTVQTARGRIRAAAWIAAGGTNRPWPPVRGFIPAKG